MALEAEAKRKAEQQKLETSVGLAPKKTIRFAPGLSQNADDQKRARPILSDEHEQTVKF